MGRLKIKSKRTWVSIHNIISNIDKQETHCVSECCGSTIIPAYNANDAQTVNVKVQSMHKNHPNKINSDTSDGNIETFGHPYRPIDFLLQNSPKNDSIVQEKMFPFLKVINWFISIVFSLSYQTVVLICLSSINFWVYNCQYAGGYAWVKRHRFSLLSYT